MALTMNKAAIAHGIGIDVQVPDDIIFLFQYVPEIMCKYIGKCTKIFDIVNKPHVGFLTSR